MRAFSVRWWSISSSGSWSVVAELDAVVGSIAIAAVAE